MVQETDQIAGWVSSPGLTMQRGAECAFTFLLLPPRIASRGSDGDVNEVRQDTWALRRITSSIASIWV